MPGNLVTATIKVGNEQTASASEYVDLWRWKFGLKLKAVVH
jgi:hypothetical protein